MDILAPFDHNLECPVCRERLNIVARVNIISSSAGIGGTDGLGHPTSIPVHVNTKPTELIIREHQCQIKLKADN